MILHLLGSRGVPTFLFGMMALLAGAAAARSSGPADFIFHLLGAALWTMFAVLVNIRPAPLRRGRSVIGVAAALTSQLAFILIGLVAGSSGSGTVLVAGDLMLGAGLLFAIASVAFLGRCFGVLPDVRGLVTRGPYRLVRHPLYLGELTAALGIVLGAQRWAPALAAWLVCLGLQLVRTKYEERSLRAQFPEYAPYADRTKRLIPGLV
ncbi:MAG TPA: isoprenylcysteine carboxylmethyltransferase family protein [Gaiellales bacterium]|nr:isoprenylcysteine carboxylmethyltransferase family protein [Gaiellales bacterium]